MNPRSPASGNFTAMPEPVSPVALEQINFVVRDLIVRILAARAESS